MNKFLTGVKNHKLLILFVVVATTFCISTVVLAVDNVHLKRKLSSKHEVSSAASTASTASTLSTVVSTVSTERPPTTTSNPPNMSKYRLPTSAKPVSYDLYLKPDLNTGLFQGTLTAKTHLQETCKEIVLHSKKLTVAQVMIDGEEASFQLDDDYELLTVRKKSGEEFVKGGDVDIFINFEGVMKGKYVGFYMSSYVGGDGQRRFIATSKFEPTDARQAFPCFDEPNLKATYKVRLLKPNDSDYIALSNYPQTKEENVPEGTIVHFAETVPMSTYLACFIVSDFKYTETHFENNGSNIPFRVYASPGQLDRTTYAGQVGKACIEYFINYFNIPYPLPKLDMVAIPDFSSGAMEHWGLVTYRETALLYNESTHSASNKERVAEVVSHELAHSWFGNLVTMNWWDNLWLNEGFASYIQYKGVNVAEPSWKMMDQFLTKTLHSVLSLDATQGSHPIIQTVQTPDQITEVFDTISYNKGASVLRMLEDVVGAENFQNGVTNYLKQFKYGNAVTQDLWNNLQVVVGEKLNITEFMDTFTVQMGYPILTVTIEGDNYIFTQKRFLKDYETKMHEKNSPLNYKWNVPVTYVTNKSVRSQIHWFNHKSDKLVIEKPKDVEWLKFNPNQVGYYRVNYPESEWRNLIAKINGMSDADRTHLLEESFSIAESGELSYEIPLDLTKYLKDEKSYLPWNVASNQLQKLSLYLQNSEHNSDFKKYVISLLKPIYEELSWNDTDEGEEHLKKRARVVILDLACFMEYDDALATAKTKFVDWITQDKEVTPDLRSVVYSYGMVEANKQLWERLFEKFNKENDANEKLKMMRGLAMVRDPSLLTRLIELAKDETYVRGQDYFTLLAYICENPIGTPIVWDYVRENWSQLVERFTLNNRYLGRMIPSTVKRFLTNVKLEEMQHFFAKYPEAGAGTASRKEALETVTNNIKWLKKYKKTLESWISLNKI